MIEQGNVEPTNFEQTNVEQTKIGSQESAEARHPSKWPRRVVWLLLLAGAASALAFVIHSGISNRVQASTTLVKATEQAAVLTVSGVHPEASAPANELDLARVA